jgi:predicted small secreted protein
MMKRLIRFVAITALLLAACVAAFGGWGHTS